MLFSKLFKCATKEKIRTVFGEIPRGEYESCLAGPCPKSLILAETNNGGAISLIRLKERKSYKWNSNSALDDMIKEPLGPGYQYELNGIPAADIVVPNLVIWAIHLFGARVSISPKENVVFSVRAQP
jgi:hypothetical protein